MKIQGFIIVAGGDQGKMIVDVQKWKIDEQNTAIKVICREPHPFNKKQVSRRHRKIDFEVFFRNPEQKRVTHFYLISVSLTHGMHNVLTTN
jgi:hypothetical protein